MKHWTQRVRPQPPAVLPEVQQIRHAAQDLAQQAAHAPGRTANALRMMADSVMIGAAFVTAIAAGVHLYKSLFPRPHDDKHGRPGDLSAVPSAKAEGRSRGRG